MLNDTGDRSVAATPFQREVADRFGMLPNFFCTAQAAPGLIEELWGFAKAAYLDSPLPSRFKERLFVHLSRFCVVRYCIIRHVGFLLGNGRPAGDADAPTESVDEVIALLSRPIPDATRLADALARLASGNEDSPIPEPGSQAEADLFDALTVVFIEPAISERARVATRAAVGDARFELLMAYLAFIRTAHYWTETHPELAYEPDMLAVMEKRADLTALLLSPSDAERVKAGQDLRQVLAELHQSEAALWESEERQRLTVELVPVLLWSAGPDGQEIQLNDRWLTYTGQTAEETNNFGWLRAIHPDDLPETRAAFEHAFATGEPLERRHRIHKTGDGWRWHLVRHVPVRDERGEIVRWFGAAVDIHDSTLAGEALQEAEGRLQTLVEGIPQLVWRAVDGGRWTWSSSQWRAFTGQSEAESLGWGWLDALHPDDRTAAEEAWSQAMETGGFEVEYRVCKASTKAYRWFQTRATPVRNDAGAIVEWLGTSTDVHDLRELQGRQEVLVAELQHRTRNLIGVIRSVADKTLRNSAELADFQPRFRDRLTALGRVQGLLSRLNDFDRVTFDELIKAEMDAIDSGADKVALSGPIGIRLRSSTVQTLAMGLHELATNAVKYGAIAQPDGRLLISWRFEPIGDGGKPWLHIDWRESGVATQPAGAAPCGGGQGRELIERALPYQLSAKTSYVLGPDGVHCTISLPVSANTVEEVFSD